MGGEVGKISFVVEAIYKAGVGIILTSLSSVGSISGYIYMKLLVVVYVCQSISGSEGG